MKIIQIVPASGWLAYYGESREKATGEPLACWAIIKDGRGKDAVGVVGLIPIKDDGNPFLIPAHEREYFTHYQRG